MHNAARAVQFPPQEVAVSFARSLAGAALMAVLTAGSGSAATAPSPVVAWKPRAWSPPATAAAGLRVAIDPVDGTRSLPAAPATSFAKPRSLPMLLRADGS